MSLVSIVVPVYNAEKTLERCVKSVCNQSYDNLEIILVNDGSTDSSYQLMEILSNNDNRIKIFNQNNMGASSARNFGINIASGKYIQFVDSDDYIDKEMTKSLVNEIESKKIDICYCLFDYNNLHNFLEIDNFVVSTSEFFKEKFRLMMDECLFQGPCNKLYKLSIVRENNILFPVDYKKLEDSCFNATYIKHVQKIGFINKKFYLYNDANSESLSKSVYIDEIKPFIQFYETIFSYIPEEATPIVWECMIKQLEVMYRVDWINRNSVATKNSKIFKSRNLIFKESNLYSELFDLPIKPKYLIFLLSIRLNNYALFDAYCAAKEGIKKIVR